jgi:hypothetical protein
MKAGDAADGGPGALTFVVANMDPDPAGEYANTWTLKLLDSSGKPVTDATLSFPGPTSRIGFSPWMPKMGHPSSIKPTAQNNGDGTYTLMNLDFTMSGIWQVIVKATSRDVSERATYTLCIK